MRATCRICLKVSNHIFRLNELTDKNENNQENEPQISYCEMYNYCTKLSASTSDKLPQAICYFCANNLITSYKIIAKAKDSEQKFLDQLQLDENKVEVDDINIPNKLGEISENQTEWESIENLTESIEVIYKIKSDETDEYHQDYEFLDETDELSMAADEEDTLNKEIYTQNLLLIEPMLMECNNFDNSSQNLETEVFETPLNLEDIVCCFKCNKNFFSQKALNLHIRRKHYNENNDNSIIFNQSIESTENETNFNDDENLENTENDFDVEILEISSSNGDNDQFQEDDILNKSQNDDDRECDSSSSSKDVKMPIENENYYCKMCKRQFKKGASFANHMSRMHKSIEENNEPKQLQSCELCGKRVKNIFNHKKLHHSIPICCELCNKELSSEKILKEHMKTHKQNVPKTIPCPKCNKFYPTLVNLKYHLQIHDTNRERKFECEICEKKFFSKAFYKSHLITHTKQEFPCHICGKVLSRKLSLDNHIKLHDDDNIKCDQCDKTFTTKSNLRIHMRFHTRDFPFVCEICGRRFPMRGHLTYHMDKHRGVSFKCQVCNKRFTSRACLREHSFVHSGMPIECNLCGKGYPNKYRFKYHLKKFHKLLNPNLEELDRIHIGKFEGSKKVHQVEINDN